MLVEGDLPSLQYRERRCRQFAEKADSAASRAAHLRIADIYKAQISMLIAGAAIKE